MNKLLQMARSEGIQGFYRGFLPTIAGVLPASAVYFYAYETAKSSDLLERLGPLSDFGVGCTAQLSAGLIFTPVDVIKERLQVLSQLSNVTLSMWQTAYINHLKRWTPQGPSEKSLLQSIG